MKMPFLKGLASIVGLLFLLVFAAGANAGEFDDLMAKLQAARDAVAVMTQNPNKRGPEQQKKVKETADEVSKALVKIKVPAEKEANFRSLLQTWKEFKWTREEELVPLILAGKQDEAVKIASGIQGDRFGKMIELCDKLAY